MGRLTILVALFAGSTLIAPPIATLGEGFDDYFAWREAGAGPLGENTVAAQMEPAQRETEAEGLPTREPGEVGLPRFPSISPDGSEIIFSWGGDLWRVSVGGGRAVRLTRHNLDDLHSSWSPDGTRIAFTSMRDGYLNVWRIDRDGTAPRQLTYSDRFIRNPSFGTDVDGSPVISFSGHLEADVYREERPYLVSTDGGEHERLHDAFGSEPRLSPDGRYVAFTRGGQYHDWNLRHYRGPDAMDVWLYDRIDDRFARVTDHNGDDGRAHWLDERTLIFMSDRDHDTVNLYRVELDLPFGGSGSGDGGVPGSEAGMPAVTASPPERLTRFRGQDVRHFDVSRDGRLAVIHAWDTLYTLDLDDAAAQPIPLRIFAGEDGRDAYTLRQIDRRVTEARLSPDERIMAYIAYGRVYVRHMDELSPTRAVTPGTHARHKDLQWSPDGLRLYFVNDSDGTESIYQATVALTRTEIREAFERSLDSHEEEALGSPDEPVDGADETREDLADVPGGPISSPSRLDSGGFVAPGSGIHLVDPEDPFGPFDPRLPPGPIEPVAPADPADPTGSEPPEEPPAEPRSVPDEELDPSDTPLVPRDLDPTRWHDAVQFAVQPVVQTAENDRTPSPSPDGRLLAFRRGRGNVVIMDLVTGTERTLVEGWDSSIDWRWSPDSRHIAYAQNDLNFSSNIFIVPVEGAGDPVNITRHPRDDLNPRWSADGRILTFISNRSGGSFDLYRVYLDSELESYTPRELSTYYRDAAADASRLRPIPVVPLESAATRDRTHERPYGNNQGAPVSAPPGGGPATAPTATALAGGRQATGPGVPSTSAAGPGVSATAPAGPGLLAASRPTVTGAAGMGTEAAMVSAMGTEEELEEGLELDLDDAWRRVDRVTALPYHEFALEMTPGGNQYISNVGGQGLMVINWDGTGRRSLGPNVAIQHLTLSGNRVVYVSGGRAGVVPVAGGPHRFVDISDRIRVDLREEALQKFREATRVIGERFYRTDMKGLDWPSVVARYELLVSRARTASEFSDIVNALLGELGASHSGLTNPGPASSLREPAGRLGIEYERVELDDGRAGFRVTHVVPGGPADRGATRPAVGDIITEVEFRPFSGHETLLQSMRGRVGEELVVTFERAVPGRSATTEYRALLTPIAYAELAELKYAEAVEASRRAVDELSDGRLGYIHIQAMNQSSLDEFQGHLYGAAYGKDGLIIDVRNNAGGSTTDRVLTSIMAAEHAYTIPAGADPSLTGHYPHDRLDAPRYTLPINMIANEKSYSNAEILAHAFRTLGRGTLVGEQTYGGVISTGTHTLLDGAVLRVPFRGWYLPDGTDMERNGAVPHLRVRQTPEDEAAGVDRQLEHAVRDLLGRLE